MYFHGLREWRPLNRQTRDTCSCMAAGQCLWARAWAAACLTHSTAETNVCSLQHCRSVVLPLPTFNSVMSEYRIVSGLWEKQFFSVQSVFFCVMYYFTSKLNRSLFVAWRRKAMWLAAVSSTFRLLDVTLRSSFNSFCVNVRSEFLPSSHWRLQRQSR